MFYTDPAAHTDYPEHSLEDPNFKLLLYHYIELVSGLSWKVPLLEQLPHQSFRSVLELGCNVGVALDYCAVAWNADAVGLEPSAYGLGGRRLLGLPIHQAFLQSCEEIRGRKFDLVFATEVLEHVPRPVELLADIRSRLTEHGMVLLTMPTAENVRPDSDAGELYATLSAGAHYFIPSEQALLEMARRAGFAFTQRWRYGNSQVLVAGMSAIRLAPLQGFEARAHAYYLKKLAAASSDKRVRLAHLIDLYEVGVMLGNSDRRYEFNAEIEASLSGLFNIDLRDCRSLTSRLAACDSLFDFGRCIPYGLPKYLRGRAHADDDGYFHALSALVCAHGLRLDFQNLYLYHERLRWALDECSRRSLSAEAKGVLESARQVIASVPELQSKHVTGVPEGLVRRLIRSARERLSAFRRWS